MKDRILTLGDVVLSKKGRDAGNYFLVVLTDRDFVYIADGRKHALAKPKKKNAKHLTYFGSLKNLAEKLKNGTKVFDSEVKSALRQFNEPSEN
ncbi:MAG: KOW domain-containing RNA-binding protein [Corallococcus sp.]|nr:KOW domain-containing RNA-binding protein [Corallococcus sp.]